MKIPFFLLIISVLLWACNSERAIHRACIKCGNVPASSNKSDSLIIRDSSVVKTGTVHTPAAESSKVGTVNCDSMGNVVLQLQDSISSGLLRAPEVIIRNNIIYAKCKVDSGSIAFNYIEHHKDRFTAKRDSVVQIQVQYRNTPLTWWQTLQLNTWWWLLAFFILIVGYHAVRLGIKIYLKTQTGGLL